MATTARSSPTVRRKELGNRLRRYRDELGLTASEVAQRTNIDPAQLSRLETGGRAPVVPYVRELCLLYKLDKATTDELLAIAVEGRQTDWWQRFKIEGPTANYLSYESAAKTISNFEAMVVPGLFQTEAYASSVIVPVRSDFTADQLAQTVASRLARRRILTGEPDVDVHAILDEGVLHRIVGGPNVMSAQLAKLVEFGELPNVTLQVLSFAAGSHPGMQGQGP